jgi:hypothetical protein
MYKEEIKTIRNNREVDMAIVVFSSQWGGESVLDSKETDMIRTGKGCIYLTYDSSKFPMCKYRSAKPSSIEIGACGYCNDYTEKVEEEKIPYPGKRRLKIRGDFRMPGDREWKKER